MEENEDYDEYVQEEETIQEVRACAPEKIILRAMAATSPYCLNLARRQPVHLQWHQVNIADGAPLPEANRRPCSLRYPTRSVLSDTMSTGASFPVLPSEVRLKVYQNLLATAAGVILETVSEQRFLVSMKDRVDLQTLRVCRHYYEDALPVVCNSQAFHVEDAFYRMLPFFSTRLGLERAALIRRAMWKAYMPTKKPTIMTHRSRIYDCSFVPWRVSTCSSCTLPGKHTAAVMWKTSLLARRGSKLLAMQ
jgi:hypothetical protein